MNVTEAFKILHDTLRSVHSLEIKLEPARRDRESRIEIRTIILPTKEEYGELLDYMKESHIENSLFVAPINREPEE